MGEAQKRPARDWLGRSKVERGKGRKEAKLESQSLIHVCAPEKLLDLVPPNYVIMRICKRARRSHYCLF